jgi:hypothetical protein
MNEMSRHSSSSVHAGDDGSRRTRQEFFAPPEELFLPPTISSLTNWFFHGKLGLDPVNPARISCQRPRRGPADPERGDWPTQFAANWVQTRPS